MVPFDADFCSSRNVGTFSKLVLLVGLMLLGASTNWILSSRESLQTEKVRIEEAHANLLKIIGRLSKLEVASQAERAPKALEDISFLLPALAVPHGNCGLVVRNRTQGPQQMCMYSEAELRAILEMPHGCRRHEPSYYHEGKWMQMQELRLAVMHAVEGPVSVVCVLVCMDTPAPCDHLSCLLPFYLRRSSSDVKVLDQLVERGEYDRVEPRYNFTSILDAGANVGIASVLFSIIFPHAKLVALEASQANFEVLQRNIAPFPQVTAVNAALWPYPAPLALVRGTRKRSKLDQWGYMVVTADEVTTTQRVEDSLVGVSVPHLQKLLGIGSFDFLKIDVEGSERELFTRSKLNPDLSWIAGARLVAIEVHEDMRPGAADVVKKVFQEELTGWNLQVAGLSEYRMYLNTNHS
eukprot:jgi/Mesen1/276/ME1152359C09517